MQVEAFKAVLANTSYPDLPIWLSESNSICSGGVAGLTDSYANTPWLLNQLGRLGLAGVQVMAQQTLLGENYGLLADLDDRTQGPGWEHNLTARPVRLLSSELHAPPSDCHNYSSWRLLLSQQLLHSLGVKPKPASV